MQKNTGGQIQFATKKKQSKFYRITIKNIILIFNEKKLDHDDYLNTVS